MTDIATRAESAAPEETMGLLEELWNAQWVKAGHAVTTGTIFPCKGWTDFRALLDINTPEAHLAAAMMLVTDQRGPWSSWNWAVANIDNAATPALALIAAISKAIGGPHD